VPNSQRFTKTRARAASTVAANFRTLVFREGDEILIQSRDEKPLNRYFPELLDPLAQTLPERCVLDGELVIVKDDELDFDALQLRLHPAASRVKHLCSN
jgi:ATP-dependent DNA ligase